MKKYFVCALLSMLSMGMFAVPATPYPFEVTQPDGSTIMVRLHGDEYHHFYTQLDGTPLRLNNSGFLVKDTQPLEQILLTGTTLRKEARAKEKQRVPSKYPLTGSPKALVLLVGFQDVKFEQTLEDFNNLLNQSGYSHNGAIGSCRDYFIAASDSIFQPQFDVYGPFTLSQNIAYYGERDSKYNDARPYQMVIEACQMAARSGVDFSQYDTDGDGVLDNVFIFFAGHNESEGAPSNSIWPHQSNISILGESVDGLRLATYACAAEHSGSSGNTRAGVGTFCHEFGHVLGLPDLYDTGYQYYSVGDWSIMGSGSHTDRGRTPPTYSAYERFYLGWLQPQQLTEKGQYTLLPLQEENQAYLIANAQHNLNGKSPNPTEFFMLEYRTRTLWDAYLPGEGMLVWHIDFSPSAWDNNSPNNGPNIMRVHLEEANGISWDKRSNGDMGRASDPYPGVQNVTSFTPKLHDGTALYDQNIFEITDHKGSLSFIYKGVGDVQLVIDKNELELTTTVSDEKRIVDWQPKSFVLTAQDLNSDSITLTSKGNFYVAIGEEAPERGSKEWKKVLDINTEKSAHYSQTVWVSFIPSKQTCDEVIGSVTITTLGASQVISLKGYSPRPIYITKPEMRPATDITANSFRINWKPVEDAVLYYITLYQAVDGEANFLQGFESFSNQQQILDAGWQSNITRTSTSAKKEGTRSLFFMNTGEYITTELYLAPITSISFWLYALSTTAEVAGHFDIEAWNGSEWVNLPDAQTIVPYPFAGKVITYNFDIEDNYTQFRLTFTDEGGKGVLMDAFITTCSRDITYFYRGKELTVDAIADEAYCTYQITNVAPGATFYCSMQSSDITKGCEEHISPLSEPIAITTLGVNNQGGDTQKENQLNISLIGNTGAKPDVIVSLNEPTQGAWLHVYSLTGALVCSIPVEAGVYTYAIPTEGLHSGNIYLIKHVENGKMKRKQSWAKFVL
jgi:M6 family metalloprotease-like protein